MDFIDEWSFNSAFGTYIRKLAKERGIAIGKIETDCLLPPNLFREMQYGGKRIGLYGASQVCKYLNLSLEEITDHILKGENI